MEMLNPRWLLPEIRRMLERDGVTQAHKPHNSLSLNSDQHQISPHHISTL